MLLECAAYINGLKNKAMSDEQPVNIKSKKKFPNVPNMCVGGKGKKFFLLLISLTLFISLSLVFSFACWGEEQMTEEKYLKIIPLPTTIG